MYFTRESACSLLASKLKGSLPYMSLSRFRLIKSNFSLVSPGWASKAVVRAKEAKIDTKATQFKSQYIPQSPSLKWALIHDMRKDAVVGKRSQVLRERV